MQIHIYRNIRNITHHGMRTCAVVNFNLPEKKQNTLRKKIQAATCRSWNLMILLTGSPLVKTVLFKKTIV